MSKRLTNVSKKRRDNYTKKVTLFVLALCMIAALSVGLGGKLVDAHDDLLGSNTQKYYKSIQLQAGDTLWDIAKEHMNQEYDTIFEYIDEVKEINNLDDDEIHEGQYLTIAYFE